MVVLSPSSPKLLQPAAHRLKISMCSNTGRHYLVFVPVPHKRIVDVANPPQQKTYPSARKPHALSPVDRAS